MRSASHSTPASRSQAPPPSVNPPTVVPVVPTTIQPTIPLITATAPAATFLVGFATPCTSNQLQTSVVDTGGGLGSVEGWLRFVDTSAFACHLSGWPTLVGVTASGGTTVARRSNALLAPPPEAVVPTVLLAPGDAAVAAFSGSDNPVGNAASCPPSYRTLRVTPPDSGQAISLSVWNYWLGADLPACAGIEVTMVVPATTEPDLTP
jgi:hypothetical protein